MSTTGIVGPVGGMDANHLEILVCYLKHLHDGSCDFGEFAKERGISRNSNAVRSFRDMIKKYGLVYDGKKFVLASEVDGDGDASANATTLATPATTPAKKVATPRKRKAKAEGDANEEDGASPKKKPTPRKPKKESVKAEEDEVDNNAED